MSDPVLPLSDCFPNPESYYFFRGSTEERVRGDDASVADRLRGLAERGEETWRAGLEAWTRLPEDLLGTWVRAEDHEVCWSSRAEIERRSLEGPVEVYVRGRGWLMREGRLSSSRDPDETAENTEMGDNPSGWIAGLRSGDRMCIRTALDRIEARLRRVQFTPNEEPLSELAEFATLGGGIALSAVVEQVEQLSTHERVAGFESVEYLFGVYSKHSLTWRRMCHEYPKLASEMLPSVARGCGATSRAVCRSAWRALRYLLVSPSTADGLLIDEALSVVSAEHLVDLRMHGEGDDVVRVLAAIARTSKDRWQVVARGGVIRSEIERASARALTNHEWPWWLHPGTSAGISDVFDAEWRAASSSIVLPVSAVIWRGRGRESFDSKVSYASSSPHAGYRYLGVVGKLASAPEATITPEVRRSILSDLVDLYSRQFSYLWSYYGFSVELSQVAALAKDMHGRPHRELLKPLLTALDSASKRKSRQWEGMSERLRGDVGEARAALEML